ncbi:amidase domain-containing protein [Thermoanaerobacterium thermosaccharolyticum]|uniref:amidase domain-containing protein n=1 Tax=Thermoanaerobacterium thermosaccharolyticum TaxID=1517 RepID=UPI003D2A432F
MKGLKMAKGILLALLMLSLLTTAFASVTYAKADYTNDYKDTIEQKVKNVLTNGFGQFYTINSIQVKFNDLKVTDSKVEANLFVTMNTTLKAKKVEDLPYIKGMLKKVNLNNFKYESNAKMNSALFEANKNSLKEYQLSKASKELEFRFNDLSQYINKADDNNFFLTVTADVKDNQIVQDSINIMAENIDTMVPIQNLLPKSSEEMETEGIHDMQQVLNLQKEEYSPALYASYDRIAARDYANRWSINATSCYDHGTSCGILQARNTWNNSAYPYYPGLCHNDCADFVSQALHAGGIPTDGTWYRGATAKQTAASWVNTSSLKSYMLNKGYWKASNYTSASAGGVLYTSTSHVVMIVKNDTITRQFSGHTNDRNQVNYSNVSGYEYYVLWN